MVILGQKLTAIAYAKALQNGHFSSKTKIAQNMQKRTLQLD